MRIAHLSDFHLRHHVPGTASIDARRSREMPALLPLALRHLAGLAPDLLVISGDLLDYPLDALDDPAMQDAGRRDLELIAGYLADFPAPLALVHGNHDHPTLIDQVFGHVPADQTLGGYRILAFRDDEGADHVPVRVGESRQRFLAALADTASPPQVHIQHYIVWPEHNEEYPHTYGAGAAMRDAILAAGNVRLVLSGHYHTGVPLFCDKGVYFATVRAFTEAPHPYAVYDLHADGTVTQQTYYAADLTGGAPSRHA